MTTNIKLNERAHKYRTPNCTHENWADKVNEHLDNVLDKETFENGFTDQWDFNEPMFSIDQRRNPPYVANAYSGQSGQLFRN